MKPSVQKKAEGEIEEALKMFDQIVEERKREIIARNCKVVRLFVRRDGFTDSETLKYKELTGEQFAYLIKREYKMPVIKRLSIASDEQLPPYMDNDRITFYPNTWRWNKKVLEIMYEEL